MKNLLYKELHLAALPLTYYFTAAALLTFVPGYPILLGAFFTTLGIFYSFQTMRENNDIRYSLLLPIAKADVVRAKYLFTAVIEGISFAVMCLITLIRMTLLRDAPVYTSNALMCANFVFLGFALLLFGLFNLVFVGGFFRTAYYFGKPFLLYCVLAIVTVTAAEALHFFPGLGAMNAFGFDHLPLQLLVLLGGLLAFVLLTLCAEKNSERNFEKTDL